MSHLLSSKICELLFYLLHIFPTTKRAASGMFMCCALSLVVSTCLADPVFPENSRAFPRSDQIMHRGNTRDVVKKDAISKKINVIIHLCNFKFMY